MSVCPRRPILYTKLLYMGQDFLYIQTYSNGVMESYPIFVVYTLNKMSKISWTFSSNSGLWRIWVTPLECAYFWRTQYDLWSMQSVLHYVCVNITSYSPSVCPCPIVDKQQGISIWMPMIKVADPGWDWPDPGPSFEKIRIPYIRVHHSRKNRIRIYPNL